MRLNKSMKKHKKISAITCLLLTLVVTIIVLYPFVWVLSTALKNNTELFVFPPKMIPDQAVWRNFIDAWRLIDFPRSFFNSFMVSVPTALLTVVVCSMAAYAMTRMKFKYATAVFMIYLSTMMIPMVVRGKVEGAMKKLNYQPNQLARSFHSKKTFYIGLLIPDVTIPFFTEMTGRIETRLHKQGYKLFLCNAKGRGTDEVQYLNMLFQNKVDGIIIGTHMLKTEDYRAIELPVVALDVTLSDSIPIVSSDHAKGGRLAAEEFVRNQCKCVIQLVGDVNIKTPSFIRNNVFSQILKENNIRCINYSMKNSELSRERYYSIAKKIFEEYPQIDGVFSTDLVVANVMKYLLDIGKKIPEDVKIVGYDGGDVAKLMYPSMTYVEQPFDLIADKIVDILLRKINGEKISSSIVLPEIKLVRGMTT